jgi:2-polyprenyl-3-methyl-5-hydroxy-6-metoxy-1,4-benzoquinol methylase
LTDPADGYLAASRAPQKGSTELPLENPYGHTKKVQLTLDVIQRQKNKKDGAQLKILDIGCGSGFAVTRFLASFGDEVLGVDFYQPNIDYANKHFGTANLSFACRDATQLRDEGYRYDIVVLTDVLEHLHEPDKILDLVRDLLLPDGCAIVSIPNGFGPFEIESYLWRVPILGRILDRSFAAGAFIMNRSIAKGRWTELLRRQPSDLPYNSDSPHVQWFTEKRFRAVVKDAGFEISDFRKLSTFSGPFSNYTFGPFVGICKVNAKLADMLPRALASAWWMQLSPVR